MSLLKWLFNNASVGFDVVRHPEKLGYLFNNSYVNVTTSGAGTVFNGRNVL